MKKKLSLLIYLAIAGALLAYIVLVDADLLSTSQQARQQGRVFDFRGQDIQTIRLRRGSETVVLERRGPAEWEITEPLRAPGAAAIVRQILTEIEFAQQMRSEPVASFGEEKGEKLKGLGLNPAAVRFELSDGEAAYGLELGHALPSGGLLFARKMGDEEAPVIVVREKLLKFAALRLNDLRGRVLFTRPPGEIVSATLLKAGEGIDGAAQEAIARDEAGVWSLRKPLIYPVTAPGVKDWLSRLSRFHVVDFVSDEPENLNLYGLATPSAQFTLGYEDGEEVTLLVGKEAAVEQPTDLEQTRLQPVYYAKLLGSPSVFLLEREVVDAQLGSLQALRDRQVLPFDVGLVEGIKVTRGKRQVDISKVDKGWEVADLRAGRRRAKFKGDPFELYDLVSALNNLDAFEFVKDTATDLKPYGLDQPRAKVELVLAAPEGGDPVNPVLLLGDETGENIYAMVEGRPHIFAVPQAILKYLPERALDLRDGAVFGLPPGEVLEVTAKRRGQPDLVVKRAADGLFASNREGRVVDAAAAGSFFSLLAQLRAARWLDAEPPQSRLGSPDAVYTLKLKDGGKVSVAIGAEQPDGTLAARATGPEGRREAFLLSAEDRRLLERDLFLPELPAEAPPPAEMPSTETDRP